MSNHWLKKSELPEGPICAFICCSQDTVPGGYMKDLVNCSTLVECLDQALEHSKSIQHMMAGPVDKIIFMTGTTKLYDNIPGLELLRKTRTENTFSTWTKLKGKHE